MGDIVTEEEKNAEIDGLLNILQHEGIHGNGDLEQQILQLQGFSNIDLSNLKRNGIGHNNYDVYKDLQEFVTIDAETVVQAIEESGISGPQKIMHANCRFPVVLKEKDTEVIAHEEKSAIEISEESGCETKEEKIIEQGTADQE